MFQTGKNDLKKEKKVHGSRHLPAQLNAIIVASRLRLTPGGIRLIFLLSFVLARIWILRCSFKGIACYFLNTEKPGTFDLQQNDNRKAVMLTKMGLACSGKTSFSVSRPT